LETEAVSVTYDRFTERALFYNNNNNNNNNRISITPYGRNYRGAGGRSDQCSLKA